jgi:DNA-binding transcriptional ArsR family regulator/protein-L-isoaspartate O-methyltransferase
MLKETVTSADPGEVVRVLKSAAEPTRLRLLALLSHGELTVGELCAIVGQSQPCISHHLRLLAEARLVDRFREQRCVYYRAPVKGRHLEWLRSLLAMTDPDAAQLARDRERAEEVVRRRKVVAVPAGPSEELAQLLRQELGAGSVGELLDIGTGAGSMLQILGPRARHAIGVDISPPALRLARTRVHGAGLAHCEFRRGDMYALPFESGSFDTVTIDRVLATSQQPVQALAEAARTMRGEGRLIVVEDFDQVDARSSDNALSQLRRWLASAGLQAERLRPCDVGGGHFVIVLAHRAASAQSTARARA